MRRALAMILFLSAAGAMAQPKRPPDLEPLPEPPPPPEMLSSDDPRVNIPVQPNDRVEEVRDASGHIRALKVTPPGGNPYYLVDTSGNGQWARRDALDTDFRVPMWPIKTFD
jgi:hypothetical protein